MHNAPPVSYPVGRSRFQAGLQAALWLLGAATVALWCWQVDTLGWRQGVAALAVLGAGLFAGVAWWKTPVAALRWDGQQWFWSGGGTTFAVQVSVHLDVQHHLLLRLRPDAGRPLWCWAERASQPPHWRSLRRAVYSPARPQNETPSALGSEP
jgi:toxin CptA